LAAMVIGGAATIAGPILGSIFIVFTPEFASDVNPQLSQVIYGAVLILLMLVLPSGFMGGIRRLEMFVLGKLGRDAEWRKVGSPPAPSGGDEGPTDEAEDVEAAAPASPDGSERPD
ncbi:MAG: hypothetical protein AAGK32_00250, partial [Actinomycetota bacterium]